MITAVGSRVRALTGGRTGHATGSTSFGRRDVLALVLLAAVTAWAWIDTPWPAAPAEDAAMLMRYVEHVAAGQGVVWNVGRAPVDGATDLGVVAVSAVLTALGMSVRAAVTTVALAGWAGLVVLTYWAARRVHRRGPVVALIAGAAVAASRAPLYAAAGFAAPFFALAVAATMLAGGRLDRSPSTSAALTFAGLWLLAGLIRPEGALVGGFVVLAVLACRGRAALPTLGTAIAAFVVAAAGVVVWRWSYFGWPLPNPYYKKGGGALHVDGLVDAVRNAASLGSVLLLMWPLALADPERRRYAALTAIPITGFVAMWVLLSPATNYLGRFQYPVAALVAVSWPGLLPRDVPSWFDRRLRVAAVVTLVGVLVVVPLATGPARSSAADTGHAAVAAALVAHSAPGARVATTEAGLVPLRTGWEALDLWGLNDATIAHRGYLDPADLDRFSPTVLFVHADPHGPLGAGWDSMVATATGWAASHGYRPVRVAVDRAGPADTWQLWTSPGADPALAEALHCDTYRGWAPAPAEIALGCGRPAG
jgi:arabinofuranosyltransferase